MEAPCHKHSLRCFPKTFVLYFKLIVEQNALENTAACRVFLQDFRLPGVNFTPTVIESKQTGPLIRQDAEKAQLRRILGPFMEKRHV